MLLKLFPPAFGRQSGAVPMREMVLMISDDVASVIEEKVASGEFADAAAFIEESVREAVAIDPEFERWLQAELIPGIAEWEADPAGEVPIDDVLVRLRERHPRIARS